MTLECVEVLGNRTYVLIDRPFIIIEYDDELLRCLRDVVESLEGRTTGKGGISCYSHDMVVSTLEITCCGHAECCGDGCASVSCSVLVMF